jgi:DNA replication protein DnaC
MDQIIDFSNVKFLTEEEIAAEKQKEVEQARQERKQTMLKYVPPLYQTTDQEQLPQKALKVVKEWGWTNKREKANLLITGATGTGKTRLAWIALQLRYVKNAWQPYSIGADTFSRRLMAESNLMTEATRAHILLLDDLGKERQTPTAESALNELVRARIDYCKPTIITTSYEKGELINRFNHKQVGEGIARRILEDSVILHL